MLVISDLHLKSQEPFLSAVKHVLAWINKKFPYESLILLGDIFDSSSPSWEVFSMFARFLNIRKDYVYIIEGNHTYSTKKGHVLGGFLEFENVVPVLTDINLDIAGNDCLFLPFLQVNNKNYYENLILEKKNYDFIFTHLSPKQVAFGGVGIDFDRMGIMGTFVHGHEHIAKQFIDDLGNKHIVLGVPQPTRHLEQDQKFSVLRIENKEIEFIDVPQYFTYETLEFGELPKSKNNILNIKNAPSWETLFKTYKDLYIRKEGITFIKTENDIELETTNFTDNSLISNFNTYTVDKNISKEIFDISSYYINKYENMIVED
jgi:predicted phosphodiesterase